MAISKAPGGDGRSRYPIADSCAKLQFDGKYTSGQIIARQDVSRDLMPRYWLGIHGVDLEISEHMRDLGLADEGKSNTRRTRIQRRRKIRIWMLSERDIEFPCKAKGDETSTVQYLQGSCLEPRYSQHAPPSSVVDTDCRGKRKTGTLLAYLVGRQDNSTRVPEIVVHSKESQCQTLLC